MTLLRALVSRFSALLGDVYYEGTVPPDAPYPYAVVSAKIPAAFGSHILRVEFAAAFIAGFLMRR